MNYPAWQLKKGDPAAETSLAGAGCGVLLRRVLAARGCTEPAAAQAMLGQGEPLSDPFLLKDMDKAVARIEQAVENEELMVIYGDYDVDGISATAILYECLTSQGAHVRCKLPTRGSGYGLTRAALESLAQKGFRLVVTVDNGISAVEEAACARELGLDLIITDHHLPGDTLPDAVAVVDPKRADDESPFKDLCGAGVAFKLCAALEGCDPAELLEMYGELAALGTVADVMPLVGENRTIVREGLDLLQDTMRPGLHALLESAGSVGSKPFGQHADSVVIDHAEDPQHRPRQNNADCGRRKQGRFLLSAHRFQKMHPQKTHQQRPDHILVYRVKPCSTAHQIERNLGQHGEDQHPQRVFSEAAGVEVPFHRHKGKDGVSQSACTGQPLLRGQQRGPEVVHQHKGHCQNVQARCADVKAACAAGKVFLIRHTVIPLQLLICGAAASVNALTFDCNLYHTVPLVFKQIVGFLDPAQGVSVGDERLGIQLALCD